jgi:Uma2 family endonuclease
MVMLVHNEPEVQDPPPPLKHAHIRRWTIAEYHRLWECGFFKPDEAIELIEGQIVRMMPQGRRHTNSIAHANRVLVQYFGNDYYVIPGEPMEASMYSEPKPDMVVVEAEPFDDPDRPAPVLLVVEVSNTSVLYDREDKSSVYAAAEIPEYWILNVRQRHLEVRRKPGRLKGRGLRHGFHDVVVLDENQQVAPLFRPGAPIAVRDLL